MDSEIIREVQNGSHDAFDQLMQDHQAMVYRVAYSFAKNTDSAMDISQNVFLKVYQNLDHFRGDSQIKTWISRIAFNESQNWIKKHKKQLPVDDAELPPDPARQEDNLLAKENRIMLLRCLYGLNTKYRLAVVLRYFENYSIREIARTLNCSEGVVKNMLYRSLQKLKNMIKTDELGVHDA